MNPIDAMEDYNHARCLKVTLAVERFLAEHPNLGTIGAGLAPRPRSGDKAAATQALSALVKEIHAVRKVVEGTRALRIVQS